MRKDFGAKPWVYPQPVLMIATYDENGNPDIMNAAWGGVGDDTQIFLCLAQDHKTTENILKRKAFTVSFATKKEEIPCDYLGIVSANNDPDKVKKSGLHLTKSKFVDAPIIDELPLTLECKLISYDNVHCHLFGDIINTSADERILTDGTPDITKMDLILFDICKHSYYGIGEKIGTAFSDGLKLKK